MFMKKFLATHGYLAPTPGAGGGGKGVQDVAHMEEQFDESVLDKEDTSDDDGSKFVSTEADAEVDEEDEMPSRKPKVIEKSPVERAREPKAKEKEKDEPKTLADADEVANKAEADAAAHTGKGIMPLDRHETILNKVREERDEAVRALANAQGGQRIVQTNNEITVLEAEVEGLQDKYDDAVINGEKEEARGLARQLRSKERELGDKKTSIAVSIARSEAIESTRFDIARERIEAAYPVLQPGHDDYDQKMMDAVLELTRMHQHYGYTATDAMQAAVRLKLGAEGVTQQEAASVKPRVTDETLKATRKENAVDKALKTVTKQPPTTEKVGLDNDKLGRKKTARDVLKMSDKEFDNLSDEELAEMGGDFRVVEEE